RPVLVAHHSNLYLLKFLYKFYRHHRALHSFPTRRSSDLGRAKRAPCRWQQMDRHRWVVSVRTRRLSSGRHKGGRPVGGQPDRHQDRKSTRLNSSHVKISYAVFCLKKKKKTTQHTTRNHNE